MRDDPGLDPGTIMTCLERNYGLRVASVEFLSVGLDVSAAAYRIVSGDGAVTLLKIRFGPVSEVGLWLPLALIERGVPNIRAPIRTRSSRLWCSLDASSGSTVVLLPFVEGENAMVAGMSDAQWRMFGSTLRAVHESGLGTLDGLLAIETFALPGATKVRALLERLRATPSGGSGARASAGPGAPTSESPAAARLAEFWLENAGRISRLLARVEGLGADLRARPFEPVVCHGDIHGANILVGTDGRITLIDWDGPPMPLLAPRERDLLFVVGSRIAGVVEPHNEDRFFEGYGPVAIDAAALTYFRYERIVDDLAEFGASVFGDPNLSEAARAEAADLSMAVFEPDGDIDRAEIVANRWRGG